MMKRFLPVLFLFMTGSLLVAQTTFDFEAPETSLTFDGFGGAGAGAIANPDMTGNSSATVLDISKGAGAETWGGVVTNPGPDGGVYAAPGGQICMDVWMDHLGLISLKLEMEANDDPLNYRQEVSNTVMNGWETICFDMDANSLEGDMSPGAGKTYLKIVIFPDFGTMGGTDAVSYYIDNITIPEAPSTVECETLFDFESPENSPGFTTFGGNLDGTISSMIANPDLNLDNPSAGVMEYIKAGDAPVWGGAVYELPTPIDATTLKEVCIKYWAPNAGNLTFKLELETFDNPDNWIGTEEYSAPSTWQNLCFDVTQPSFEGNMSPATGKTFLKFVIYPDFGMAGTMSDVSYYLDDYVTKRDTSEQSYDVDFSVDMNSFTGDAFTGVFVNGTFNGWAGGSNPLADDDGDGVWTGTYNLPQGSHEYKFTLDEWAQQENFNGNEDCTVSADNVNINRGLIVSNNTTLPTYCFNSCYACGQSVTLTYNLGFNTAIVVDPDNVYLAGGNGFGVPGDNKMTDDDGDGIYSISFEKPIGFASFYTFINGDCFWDCKEDIAGQDCANPDDFNDRFLDTLMTDTVINTCFGECTETADCGMTETVSITFNVDMNEETVEADGVFIAGQFTGWQNEAMDDSDGDGVYSATYNLVAGVWEWKFKNGADGWEVFADGDPCTVTFDDGNGGVFVNRATTINDGDMAINLDPTCFNSCVMCSVSTNDVTFDESLFMVTPTISNNNFLVEFDNNEEKQIRLLDVSGKLVHTATTASNEYVLNVSNQSQGIYFIQVMTSNAFKSQKVVVSK